MPPASRPPARTPTAGAKLFVECTNTFHSPVQTGIQRVVRNILRNAAEVAAPMGFAVVPVVYHHGQLRVADLNQVLADKQGRALLIAPAQPRQPFTFRALALGRGRPVYRRTRQILARLLPFPRAQRFLFAHPIEFGLAWCVLLPWRVLRRIAFKLFPSLAIPTPADPDVLQDGFGYSLDTITDHSANRLLLLDASWGIPLWPCVERFQEAGGQTMGVIYDLVPLTHVETSVRSLRQEYVEWVDEHRRLSGSFLTISKTVGRQLHAYLDTRDGPPDWTITPFYLGSELDFIDPSLQPRPEIATLFQGPQATFIVVGSIEPRKNHRYILDAFDLLWAQGGTAHLIIIGRFGWKNEDVVDRIVAHPRYNRTLFLVRDMADSELDHAYRHASALVIASEAEGFGLPVVEAFQRGLPVLCSDIEVFREIADGKATFFKLDSPQNLATAAAHFDPNTPHTPQPWLTWRESTEQLLSLALARNQGEGLRPLDPH